LALKIGRLACPALVIACLAAHSGLRGSAQTDPTLADLEALSTRTIVLGAADGSRVERVPLEVYVSRVLTGEGEPNAPEATQQALAIAIRTYALFNTGRHSREGYDLCDSTHCQVPRAAANASSRRAALATSGRILTYRGAPAEIYYSASCGGRSETADAAWPLTGTKLPYLRSVKDDVHGEDVPWRLEMPLVALQADLNRNGFSGELKKIEVSARSKSGRAAVIKLSGMRPDRVDGDRFRATIGYAKLRSTAFSVKKKDGILQFTGRGYGHGVGMCVIGAGRRARRGETAAEILKAYYPGLMIQSLSS
jgi:stage II sporulation protein D